LDTLFVVGSIPEFKAVEVLGTIGIAIYDTNIICVAKVHSPLKSKKYDMIANYFLKDYSPEIPLLCSNFGSVVSNIFLVG
jgi:hypothetical protein